jgi:hypothetical protein
MIALSDNQLASVITAAGKLAAEKRGLFLERVVARLSFLPRFTAAEFDRRGAPSLVRPDPR